MRPDFYSPNDHVAERRRGTSTDSEMKRPITPWPVNVAEVMQH